MQILQMLQAQDMLLSGWWAAGEIKNKSNSVANSHIQEPIWVAVMMATT